VVDATAASGVVARYNSIRTAADGVVNYRWAGTSYPDADVTGYFTRGSGETYVPVTPVRASTTAMLRSTSPST